MNTKLLRQKILDLAIRGKLTEQKKSDGTTKDLLAAIVASSPSCHSERSAKGAKSKNLGKSKKDVAKEIIPLDKSEASFEIPENWEWVRLGDIVKQMTDFTASGSFASLRENVKYYKEENYALLVRTTDFRYGFQRDLTYTDQHGYEFLSNSNLFGGELILSNIGASIGKVFIVPKLNCRMTLAPNSIMIRHYDTAQRDWLYYFFLSPAGQQTLFSISSSTAQAKFNKTELKSVSIPLPPLAEQQRIVDAIKNAFAEITAIENNQELLKKNIKQGRQKILDLAIRGKLTEQKPSDGTTKDLLKSIVASSAVIASEAKQSKKKQPAITEIIPLDKSEAPFEIPENWEWVKLGDICDKLIDGDHNPPKGIDEQTEYLMLSSRNINDDRIVDLENVRYLPKEVFEEEDKRTNLAEGDILFTSVGSLGRSCVYNGNGKFCFQRSVTVVHTRILNYYLKYFFDSEYYQKVILENATGTAQLGFYLEQMRKSLIAVPPLAEQQRIVATIQETFAEFDAMEK